MTNIIHIQYHKRSNKINLITFVPDIGDIIFNWNVTDIIQNHHTKLCHKAYYSDNFGNDCFCLKFMPNETGYDNEYHYDAGLTHIYLQLNKVPFDNQRMVMQLQYQFTMNINNEMHFDETKQIGIGLMEDKSGRKLHRQFEFGYSWYTAQVCLFSKFLHKHWFDDNDLSFTIKIKPYNIIGQKWCEIE